MKQRIVIGLAVLSCILFAMVAYTIVSIERATARLEGLVDMHRVELIRESLLITLKRTQSDLYLKNTRYARSVDTIVRHVQDLNRVTGSCLQCHHEEQVRARLENMNGRVLEYEDALSRVLTMRANRARLEQEEDTAHKIGSALVAEVEDITTLANARLAARTREVWSDIDRSKWALYLLFAVMPFLSIGFGVLLMRGVTRPINALLTATRRLQSGDLSYRIQGLHDEHGEVAASFNEMARTLEQHWERMQWTEQIVVLGELAGGLAHEINNPLAGIMNVMQVFADDPALPPQHKAIVVEVGHELERIEALVKNLLNFARPPRPCLMAVAVNEVLEGTLLLAQRHPLFARRAAGAVEVVKDYDAKLPAIEADPAQLGQVFLNLLLNAADAIQGSGTVTVTTRHDAANELVRVVVEDTGCGLAADVKAKLFLPFFTTKAKGTGLGLATTKRLIEQHGGRISCENRPGGGAQFSIALRVRPQSFAPAPAMAAGAR